MTGPLFWAVLLLVVGWAGKRAEGRKGGRFRSDNG